MINSNTVLPLVSTIVGQQGNSQTKRDSSDFNFADFKDILSSSVNRTYSKQKSERAYTAAKSEKPIVGKEVPGQVKSFNEAITKSQRHFGNNKAAGKEETGTEYDKNKIEDHSEDGGLKEKVLKEKVLKETLAMTLGITGNELDTLMAALNINPCEIMDSANIEAIAQRISDYIGLSSDQQRTLSKILPLVQKEIKHSFDELRIFSNLVQKPEMTTDKEDWIELEGVDIEVIEEAGEPGDKIVQALNRLKEMVHQQPDKLISQISGKVQNVLKQSIEPVDTASIQIAVKEENLPAEDESENSSDESEDSDLKDRKDSIETMDLKDNQGFVSKIKDDGGNEFVALSFNVNQKPVQEAGISQTIQSKTPVTRIEIFTQVVEKAKVLLSGDKSEMVIDLKPDHLGKLALKIATERGTVVAKFIAENEQVKAALESNMNLLKESLEKQGFSVQEFSVFVGGNRERGGNGENMQHGSHVKSGVKDKLPAIGMVDVESLEQMNSGNSYYDDGTSRINLTA